MKFSVNDLALGSCGFGKVHRVIEAFLPFLAATVWSKLYDFVDDLAQVVGDRVGLCELIDIGQNCFDVRLLRSVLVKV